SHSFQHIQVTTYQSAHMNLLANPIKLPIPPPPEPPWLCIYIFNAISPACCTALSLLAPPATFPALAWLSKSLAAWPIAIPMNAFWELPPAELPDWPPVNILSPCIAAADPIAPEDAG